MGVIARLCQQEHPEHVSFPKPRLLLAAGRHTSKTLTPHPKFLLQRTIAWAESVTVGEISSPCWGVVFAVDPQRLQSSTIQS